MLTILTYFPIHVALLVWVTVSNQSCDTWFRHHWVQWLLKDWLWSLPSEGSLQLQPSPVSVTLRRHSCEYWDWLLIVRSTRTQRMPPENDFNDINRRSRKGNIAKKYLAKNWIASLYDLGKGFKHTHHTSTPTILPATIPIPIHYPTTPI